MSTKHLPRVISQRGKTAVEIERENFEKNQTAAINKAINNQETPVKEKHVRTIVLGTFQDHGAGFFWSIAIKLPVQANPIICWKFLHVLHKILREGHADAIIDSFKYCSHLTDLGKLWNHLREGYGRLIGAYCKLLVEKLNYHRKNNQIPGNLLMADEQFTKICGGDVNNYDVKESFEISVDMLDYMDEILQLQQSVFSSLDMSRSNSMTNSGQCRLAPLILCIQDSCQLYDYIVKSLFRLHSSLPPDTLSGHRDRFLSAYKRLKQFYYSSHNLQYFKNLVQVPVLPDEPPNFLIASDFSKHVKPVAVVPNEPEPDPEPETPETESVEDLIDTSVQDKFDAAFGNGFGPPEIDERDLIIERLTRQVQELRAELERVKAEDQQVINKLREEKARLEKILAELRISADASLKENDELKRNLKEAETKASAADKLSESEKHAKANEEKFKKMKDIYGKLREEHVALLRTHAEVSKKLDSEKRAVQEKEQLVKESQSQMERLEQERKIIQDSMQQSANEVQQQLAETTAQNTDLQQRREELENQVKTLESTKSSLIGQLQTAEDECSSLQTKLEEMEQEKEQEHESLSGEITLLQTKLSETESAKQSMEQKLTQELSDLKTKLEELGKDKEKSEEELKQQLKLVQEQLNQLKSDKQNSEDQLNQNIDDLHKNLIATAVEEGRVFIQDSLDQFENPTHISVKCTAEFLLSRAEPVLSSLEQLKDVHDIYSKDRTDLESFVKSITVLSHHLGDCVIHGIATTHSAQLEAGEELGNTCRTVGENGLKILDVIKKGEAVGASVDKTAESVKKLIELAEALVPKSMDVKQGEIGDLIENEMAATSQAIEQAAKRIEGTSTATEFYKKNHRWTEGLLSAAKAVGWGATTLMEAADKVVKGEGKFEELIVCSNEIAASTAQLVVASKVKADRRSEKLAKLSEASRGVTQATGKVVGSAREGAQIKEEANLMDFSQMSLLQTKKLEMQSQVRVLELEKELENERVRLGELRKSHYKLAGESEGWEVDQVSNEI
ncbi:hypothetical protein KUTeg_010031 [Tegillarca granosa]|uniref:Huntingtin-interacting protein 1 n=1 Tax=Tegillarca granosa TaxID=220873 RepID=A0ABQ9FAJ6_TEGGR|nr:hypothetical protein KUTeg_010031 [Tegillarca granosa]